MERRWGIIGFGEVGSAFGAHLLQGAAKVYVTDPRLTGGPSEDGARVKPAGTSAEVVDDIPTLVSQSEICLSVVTPGAAMEVARLAGAAWQNGLFIDFNSVSPLEKRQMSALFPAGAFVGGAILGSVAGEGAKARLALDGTSAERAQDLLKAASFNSVAVGRSIGSAAALKMCRSVFMKGIECVLVETLLAAAQFQMTEPVLETVEDTFRNYGFRPMVEMLVTTHALHCGRRADEMQRVAVMLSGMRLPNDMSEASSAFLSRSDSSGITQHFNGRLPASADSVIQFLEEIYREKR